METLQKHVRKAQWRLNLQQFIQRLIVCMCVAFSLGLIGVVVPKVWVINVDYSTWMWSWLGGSAAVGLIAAVIWTYLQRASAVSAAIEVDSRFGLKERVSSSLTLDEETKNSQWGQALVNDTIRRIERIEVTDKFPVHGRWGGLAPIAIMLVAVVFAYVLPNAVIDPASVEANPGTIDSEQKKVVKKTTDQLRKELEERKKKAKEQGLDEAEELFKKLEEGTKQLAKKDEVDHQKTLLKLNDLANELKKRREELAKSKDFKNKLESMKDISDGPADKLAKAMKNGELKDAMQAMKDLQRKMNDDQLTKDEKQKLTKQLQEMGKKLEDAAKAHEERKKALQKQIEQAKKAGNNAESKKLQQQLDQMGMQDEQMNRMKQMGEKLSQAAEQMKNGQQQDAAKQLNQMAQQMQDLQAQLDELEMLDEAMDQMESARNQMCKACQGKDGMMRPGQGMMGQQPGNGLGEGQGQGERPEEENDTGAYDSQVRADPKGGKAVIVDYVDGKNRAGRTLVDIKETMESDSSLNSDALTEVRLSKDHQQNAQEYFDMVREGR